MKSLGAKFHCRRNPPQPNMRAPPYKADAQKLPQHVRKNKTGYTALSIITPRRQKSKSITNASQTYHRTDKRMDGSTDGQTD